MTNPSEFFLNRPSSRRRFLKQAVAGGLALSAGGMLSNRMIGASSHLPAETRVLVGSHMDYLINMAAEFEALHGISLTTEQVTTTDLRDRLVSTFITRRSPWDATFVTAALNAELADRQWVVDLSERIDDLWGPEKEGLLKGSFESATQLGRTTAVPVTIGAPIMIWNKQMMTDVGLDPDRPANWHATRNSYDEFLEYAKAMTREVDGVRHYGYTDAWADTHVMYCYRWLVQALGGDVLDENLEPVMNGEEGVHALQLMIEMLHEHKVVDPAVTTYTWVFDASPAFLEARRGMFITWPFIAGVAENPEQSRIVGNVGAAPNPAIETSASSDGSEFLAIPTFAGSEETGWEYLKMATSKEMQKIQGMTTGWVPIWEELLDDPEVVANQPVAPIVKQSYQYPVNAYWAPDYARYTQILSDEIHEALAQKKTPQEAMDDAVRLIRDSRR